MRALRDRTANGIDRIREQVQQRLERFRSERYIDKYDRGVAHPSERENIQAFTQARAGEGFVGSATPPGVGGSGPTGAPPPNTDQQSPPEAGPLTPNGPPQAIDMIKRPFRPFKGIRR